MNRVQVCGMCEREGRGREGGVTLNLHTLATQDLQFLLTYLLGNLCL